MTLTYEYIKNKISENIEYQIVSKTYKNSRSKIKILHLKCGNIFDMKWNNFQTGQRCPYCFGNMKLNIKYVKKFALEEGYRITSKEYKNAISKLNFKHIECKRSFNMTWNNFQRGQRCPKCDDEMKSLSQRLNLSDLKKIASNYGYEIISERYNNNFDKLKFIHIDCGRNFEMSWGKFHGGRRCPKCSLEQKESRLATLLKKYFIDKYGAFEEYIVPDLNNRYKYDIYIPSGNNPVINGYYVEVNGKQHYEFTYYWHKTEKGFENSKKRDAIKKKYAEENGIYIEINIEKYAFESAVEYIENILKNYTKE